MPRPRDPKDFNCTRRLEAQALRRGWCRVAGCDEAGRGALLGPLYAAAVVLDPDRPIPGLDDSKKLSPHERQEFDAEIREKAVVFQVVAVTAAEVDELNVYEASRQAMLRALRAIAPPPDFVLTDAMPLARGNRDGEFTIPHRAIIHGDARCASIAAASILAKVSRDRHMLELDRTYPQYGLARNKGYGTRDHLEALARFGPCSEYRRSYQPVKDCLLPLFPFGVSA